MKEVFRKLSETTSHIVGTPPAFLTATLVVIVWAFTGPYFNYSDTWQLVINTGTTIVTFLMVFLIQATQNRDTRILNLKMDELLRALDGARNEFSSLDELSDDQLEQINKQFRSLTGAVGILLADDVEIVERELARRRR